VTNTDGTDAGRIVRSLPVAAGTPTRLAFKGSHLRLIGLRRDVPSGTTVPVTLQFTAKGGKRYTAKADVQVRGISAQQPEPPPAPASAPTTRKGS
jgi:copper(I)-binding protein